MKLFKRAAKAPATVQYVERDMCRVTLGEWCATPHLVNAGAKLLSDPTMKWALDCLANSGPAHDVLALGAQPHERVAQQARIEGYGMALANLMALGVEQAQPEKLESLFADEERETARG
jgi:hypothetical protein